MSHRLVRERRHIRGRRTPAPVPAPRTGPEALLEDHWWYFDMTPEERDLEIQRVCRTAMDQWLALPEEERIRWPPEPGAEGMAILSRWAREFRERSGR